MAKQRNEKYRKGKSGIKKNWKRNDGIIANLNHLVQISTESKQHFENHLKLNGHRIQMASAVVNLRIKTGNLQSKIITDYWSYNLGRRTCI